MVKPLHAALSRRERQIMDILYRRGRATASEVMGDLSELMASIAEKGIIEPIIVRQRGSRFQIVAGERRYQAAVQVGLHEVPIVIREVDDTPGAIILSSFDPFRREVARQTIERLIADGRIHPARIEEVVEKVKELSWVKCWPLGSGKTSLRVGAVES